jgi:hypothetical protein
MRGKTLTAIWGLAAILAVVSSGILTNSPNAEHRQFAQIQRGRNLADFERKLEKSLTPKIAEERFGRPDRIAGSGLIIYVYLLDDDREIWMGFPGNAPIIYAKLKAKDGSMRDLKLE